MEAKHESTLSAPIVTADETKKKHQADDDRAGASAAKKVKVENDENSLSPFRLDIQWCMGHINEEGNWNKTSSIEEISVGKLAKSRAIQKNEAGENNEFRLEFVLRDNNTNSSSSSSNSTILASLSTYCWVDMAGANLMHFNQLSQDLANFCRPLWVDAGCRERDYSDMAIEFGESQYSRVKVNHLVKRATGIDKTEIVYIKSVQDVKEPCHLKTLLKLIVQSLPSALIIAFETDFTDLQDNEFVNDFFAGIGRRWFVGPKKKG